MAVIPPGLVADPYLVQMQEMWAAPIRADRNFNGGEYYGQAEPIDGLKEALKLITYTALHHDWARRLFSGKQGARWADPDRNPLHSLENRFAIDVALEETAHARALVADANSVLRLCRAVQLAGIRDRISNVRARFLIIPSATDLLIPAACAERGAKELRAAGLSVDMFTIEGDGGHLDGLTLISQADAAIRKFLANSTR